MLDLDPQSLPVAVLEIVLLLSVAALLGYGLGRLLRAGQVNALRSAVAARKAELDACRQEKTTAPPATAPVAAVRPAPEPTPAANRPVAAPAPVSPADLPPIFPTPAPGNSEAEVLTRIAARAGELNFDRIGRATAAEADDLKDIMGVGPFLERKLHSLGIFTYRQIANFTKEDIQKLNEIIEFFPGRIERDDWVGQATRMQQQKYGREKQ